MLRNKTLKFALAALIGAAVCSSMTSLAQPSAHYIPGLEGIKAATLPPPGIYLRDYNVFYYSDRLNDNKGNEVPIDAEAMIYANAPRLVWITDIKLLGGYLGFDGLVPFQYTSLEANVPSHYDDSTFGIGDAFGEVTLSWHGKQFDAAIGYGIWAPTGDSSPEPLSTRAGSGFWTHMFTAGATLYPDEAKKWALSVLNRYEINTEKDETDITRGDVWTVEGSLSRALSSTVEAGVVAYYQRQLEGDKGAHATPGLDWVTGVGPEIAVFYPRVALGWSLRYVYEIEAENRLQGHTAVLTITKKF